MSEKQEAISILREIWSQEKIEELDAECGPNKVCRNMEHVNYGYTPEDWKAKLKAEGKWSE